MIVVSVVMGVPSVSLAGPVVASAFAQAEITIIECDLHDEMERDGSGLAVTMRTIDNSTDFADELRRLT